MSYETIVGLQVIDDQQYQQYRITMTPILATYGGSFGFDFRVSEVLSDETSQDINRLFVIKFPDASTMDNFFLDPQYLKVKARYFDDAVGSTVLLSSYERD